MSLAAGSPVVELPSRQRSALTNGAHMLAGIDGRSAQARRYRDLCMAFADELGGEVAMTEAERALCRQAAALTVRSEEMQAALVRGDAVDDEQLTRLMNSASRALSTLRHRGKARKPPTEDMHTYLRRRAAGVAA